MFHSDKQVMEPIFPSFPLPFTRTKPRAAPGLKEGGGPPASGQLGVEGEVVWDEYRIEHVHQPHKYSDISESVMCACMSQIQR